MKGFFKSYVYPIATLSGSIIGVGFLSLPYVALKSGIWTMLFYFAFFTILVTFIHVIFGEIALKTPDFKRWPGFLEYYFGSWAKKFILIPIILGSFGVLLAYLIVGSQFLGAILSPVLGGSSFVYFLVYLLTLSAIVYLKVDKTSKIQLWTIILLIVSLFVIFAKGFWHISLANLFAESPSLNIHNLFLPYGAILFALWGTALIPETEEMVRGHKSSLKKIIIISTLIPAAIYVLFTVMVLGLTGGNTTESALVGIKNTLGDGLSSVILFVGVITTFTAFIAQGLFLKKVFMYDLKINEKMSWALVCFTPLILFLIGFNSFIPLISFVGGVLLGIDGILILLIYKRIGGNKIIAYPLITIFILGIIYSLIYFNK